MSRQAPSATRVRITIGTKSIEATLADSEAARDFASLLPITLPMNDLFRREKFAHGRAPSRNKGNERMIMPSGPLATGLPDPTWQSSIARMGSASPIPA
jgi:hypothetical protein